MSRLEVGTERSLPQVLRRMIVPAIFVGALFMVVLWRSPEPVPEGGESSIEMLLAGPTMGTRYTVKVVAEGPVADESRTALEASIEAALEEVDASMSTWREDSELERFNRGGKEPFAASDAFLEVLGVALEVSEASAGAFDVTVGPLVDAWGFGSADVSAEPTGDELARLLESSGSEHLRVDPERSVVQKDRETLRVDLSALAKGYAVDRVATALRDSGYSSFMVEVGGEVVAQGRNADGRSWRVGIEEPDAVQRTVYAAVTLDGSALATSGDYRNYRISEGRRISHIIDPRTGRPAGHSLASVSVVSSTCMVADAWATALSVLGPEDGLALARQLDLAALFIFRRDDGTLGESSTRGFETHRVQKENQP